MKFKVGKERISSETMSKKCPKMGCVGRLYPRNGSNSYPTFSKGAINYWKCSACNREFEAIIEW